MSKFNKQELRLNAALLFNRKHFACTESALTATNVTARSLLTFLITVERCSY